MQLLTVYKFAQNSADYAILGGSSKIAAMLLTYPFQVDELIIHCINFLFFLNLFADLITCVFCGFVFSGYSCSIAGTFHVQNLCICGCQIFGISIFETHKLF